VGDTFWSGDSGALREEILPEIKALHYELLHRDVSTWPPVVHENQARKRLLEQGANSVDRFIEDIQHRGFLQAVEDYRSVMQGTTVDDGAFDAARFTISKKMFFAMYRQFCKEDAVSHVKLPRFNRQIKELTRVEQDVILQRSPDAPRVRSFDLTALFEVV
jgi:hypothetical protein